MLHHLFALSSDFLGGAEAAGTRGALRTLLCSIFVKITLRNPEFLDCHLPSRIPEELITRAKPPELPMKVRLLLVAVAASILLLCVPAAFSQTQPICDTLCGPDPNGSSYGGVVAARPMPLNARGQSSATTPLLKKKAVDPTWGNMSVVVGSQSYNYTIPDLHLPGRNGMDLTLNLYYNARVWTVDPTGKTVTFNADRDFPSYGFRLDFGYIEKQGTAGWVLTEADGTKRFLSNGGVASQPSDSVDGSAIEFNSSTHVLSYANGTTVQYLVFPSQANSSSPTLFRPVWIKDTNGNYFSIAYVSGKDQAIQAVSDTLGRVINFE
jgi:hypothetical protein